MADDRKINRHAIACVFWFLVWFAALPIACGLYGWGAGLLCWLCSGGAWNFRLSHDAFEAEYRKRATDAGGG